MSMEDASKDPLMGENDSDSESSHWRDSTEFHLMRKKKSAAKKTVFGVLFVLPWILAVWQGVWNWKFSRELKSRYYIRPELTYSPAQEAVEYETKIYTTGLPEDTDISPYAGEPSPEVDAAWKGLYPSLYQLISKEQAAKLPNKTVIFPHDDQRRYVIELEVFHKLHCLNMIRQAFRPDYYKHVIPEGETEDRLRGTRHVGHCIEVIRQALMCSSDISVYTWSWSDETHSYGNEVKNPHTCRNFDKLRDWSTENTEKVYFDWDYREMNDPLDPSTWVHGYTGS